MKDILQKLLSRGQEIMSNHIITPLGGTIIFGVLFFSVALWSLFITSAPNDFQGEKIISVYSGMTIKELSVLLEDQQIVRSKKIFHSIIATQWRNKSIITGDYIFEKPQSVFSVAYRFTHGVYGNSRIKVTFPEGVTRYDMADILSEKVPNFMRDDFLEITRLSEGFLFPDTYYFFRTHSGEQIAASLQQQFQNKMKTFTSDFIFQPDSFNDSLTTVTFAGKKRTITEIITFASILEREAYNSVEAKTIAGILWKRMSKNMPLQVDATFKYTLGKSSEELTRADLKNDSPYNTYTRLGLPVGPIGNPGIAMIDATLHPTDSPYWYYLHDALGRIHYATTYQQHLENKRKYID